MRTNIVLDDQLVKQAMQMTGLDTKKAVVEEGLRLLVRMHREKGGNPLLQFAGTISDEEADAMLDIIYNHRINKPILDA